MNGQNPNNQLNQDNSNVMNSENPSVLGSLEPQSLGATPQPNPVNLNETVNVAGANGTPNTLDGGQISGSTPNMEQPGVGINPNFQAPLNNQINEPNVGTNPNVTPMATGDINQPNVNPTPVENVNPTPVAQPIPGTAGTPYQANSLTGNTVGVGTPSVGQDNLNSNGFVEPNKVENIGAVPPPNIETAPKKRKPMNKTLFVVLIIVLIAAVAFGVYYFLNMGSNSLNVTVKNVTIGVGETLSDNITDYATISGEGSGSCTLNTRNVDPMTIGEYPFTITCGTETFNGTINVADVDAPEISLNTVYKQVNSTVTVDEFVASCTDPSECSTSFANENTLASYLQTAGGPYSIDIVATDGAGNSQTVTTELYVTEYPIQIFRNCESPSSAVSGYQATKTVTDYLPMGNGAGNGVAYLGVSQRIHTYVFTNSEEYTTVVGDKPATLTFDGVTGRASYNDDDLTIVITTDLSIDTLNSEAGGTFPTIYNEMGTYYTNLGYTCSITNANNQ